MRVELVGFSQGVSFEEKGLMLNYLDFRKGDGSMFRIPVPEESMQVLLKEVYSNGHTKVADPVVEETPEEATHFGGDFVPDQEPEEEPEDPYVQESPESEDEVPSI